MNKFDTIIENTLDEGFFGDIKKAFRSGVESGSAKTLYRDHPEWFIDFFGPHFESDWKNEVVFQALKDGHNVERQLDLLAPAVGEIIDRDGGILKFIKKHGADIKRFKK